MQATDAPADQQNAIARWSQVAQYLDDEIANLKEGLRLGYTAPKGNVQSVIAQVNAMLAAPDRRLAVRADGEGRTSPASFKKTLEDQERTMIRPAITRYRDFLQTDVSAGRARGDRRQRESEWRRRATRRP